MISILNENIIKVEFEIGEINKELFSFLSMLDINSHSKISEEDIWNLSEEIKKNWWEKNKDKFINENSSR